MNLSDLPPKMRAQAERQIKAQIAKKQSATLDFHQDAPKENKYHAEKDRRGDIQFDSRREARRYDELLLMEQSGLIADLRLQVKYELIPTQKKPDGKTERGVSYIADFVYEQDGKTVVEDAKGHRTPEYVIKRKLMLYLHGIAIQEV